MLSLSLAATLPVGLGVALALLPWLRPGLLGAARAFALATALVVVLLGLVPEAVHAVGLSALLPFAAGLLLPGIAEGLLARVSHARARPPGRLALEAGFFALLLHQLTDGLEIGGAAALGAEPWPVALAVAAHSTPLVALASLQWVRSGGRQDAMWRGLVLMFTTWLGLMLGAQLGVHVPEAAVAYAMSALGGLLLHVLWHDLSVDPPTAPLARGAELLAAALGTALPLLWLDLDALRAGHPERGVALSAALELLLTEGAAAMLVAVLLVAALRALRAPPRGAGIGAGLLAALWSTSQPGQPDIAGPPAGSRAQLAAQLAGPLLAMDALIIGLAYLGVGAFMIILTLGLSFAALFARLAPSTPPHGHHHPAPRPRFILQVDAAIAASAAWFGLGLWLNALLAIAPPSGQALGTGWLDTLGSLALALPMAISPIALGPFAGGLTAAGLGFAPVLVWWLLGPRSFAGLSVANPVARYAQLGFAACVVLSALGLSLLGPLPLPASLAWPLGTALPAPLPQLAATLLAALVLRGLYLRGPRAFLAALGKPHAHVHAHDAHDAHHAH